jgi:mannose-1-phosphate guanylyltransferase
MIMVFRARTLLGLVQQLCPNVYEKFMGIFAAVGTADEAKAVHETYQTLEPVNFSKAFLERLGAVRPELITVLPVLNVCWSDWGSAERLLRTQELLAALQSERSRAPSQPPQHHPSEPRRGQLRERAPA